eukprot:gnl/Chilomastix_cuspidata/3377.p1 GENE.gnl/Chilomastix_cuspidata/3377~~gnl/Chilomastix_cuspidata/3377.p1  ORF type:complete len:240 (-),score=45.74 gnl/Chilomastix_cuspidata/3377:355-1074(-)
MALQTMNPLRLDIQIPAAAPGPHGRPLGDADMMGRMYRPGLRGPRPNPLRVRPRPRPARAFAPAAGGLGPDTYTFNKAGRPVTAPPPEHIDSIRDEISSRRQAQHELVSRSLTASYAPRRAARPAARRTKQYVSPFFPPPPPHEARTLRERRARRSDPVSRHRHYAACWRAEPPTRRPGATAHGPRARGGDAVQTRWRADITTAGVAEAPAAPASGALVTTRLLDGSCTRRCAADISHG